MTTSPDALIASDYVVCATLRKVADVFNVDLLWERGRSGQDGIALMEALKRHPRAVRARQRKETRYNHVILRIPERDYVRDDRLEDGFGRQALVQELRHRHEQELGRYLADDAMIRYWVEPDPLLRSGEVQFLFGRAIHLPAEDEAPLFQIQVAAEGPADWREIGLIYPGQRLTLLNGDRRASSIAVTGWPFLSGESALLLLRPGVPPTVEVGAEPAESLILTPTGEGGFTLRDRRGRGIRVRVATVTGREVALVRPDLAARSQDALAAPAAIPLVLTVAAPDAELDAGLDGACPLIDPWGRREPLLGIPTDIDDETQPLPALSWPTPSPEPSLPPAPLPLESESQAAAELEQGTWIPSRRVAHLQVVGIALQRLSTYAAAGISDWRLSFNRAGELTPDGYPEVAAWLRIDSADRVFGEITGLSTLLDRPGVWRPFAELELTLYPAPGPMATHYLSWMRLPAPLALSVPCDRAVSFGRGSEADIAPRLLADPRSLRWDGNRTKSLGISAEYLGLSRRHLCLQARRDDWWVQLESQNMPVYRLTAAGDLLDVLNPGVNTATAAKPGELLVAGGYVLGLGTVA
jgi:hypothetical protein